MEKEKLLKVITAAQLGDPEAQSSLIEEVQKSVYYQCLKILKNEADAQDAAQETLITLLTKLDTLNEPEAFWGWINRTAVNRCKMMLRKVKELQIPEDEEGNSLPDTYEELDEQIVPDKALDNDETRRMILELIDALPTTQRMCVIMYYYDEMKTREIADVLEVSENTVKSRLNYARKAISEGVKGYEKRGIKLYGASPLPLLLFFLRRDAEQLALAPELAQTMGETALAAVNAGAIPAGDVAAASGSAQRGAEASGFAGKAAAATAGKAVGYGIAAKVVAGALAATVLLGGGGMVLSRQSGSAPAADASSQEQSETGLAEPGQSTEEPAVTDDSGLQACLELIDGADVVYAKLVDLNADGVDELIVGYESMAHTIVLWAYPVDSPTFEHAAELGTALYDGTENWSIYQHAESGQRYVGIRYVGNGLPADIYSTDLYTLDGTVIFEARGEPNDPYYYYTAWGWSGQADGTLVLSKEEFYGELEKFTQVEGLPFNSQTRDFSPLTHTVDEVRQQLKAQLG